MYNCVIVNMYMYSETKIDTSPKTAEYYHASKEIHTCACTRAVAVGSISTAMAGKIMTSER